MTHVAWVYDYALEIEPVLRKHRFDGAFRHIPQPPTLEMNEFFVPAILSHVSPWTQEGTAGASLTVKAFKGESSNVADTSATCGAADCKGTYKGAGSRWAECERRVRG